MHLENASILRCILPAEALKMIKYYHIHGLDDTKCCYSFALTRWIEIPHTYYPLELSGDTDDVLIFLLSNEHGLPGSSTIGLDIGNQENYILYSYT